MTHWPALPFEDWRDSYATLHRCAQIVGKIQLGLTPLVNHFWNAAFVLTTRGLKTAALPYRDRSFEIGFDFLDHCVVVRTSDGGVRAVALKPRPVAEFHRELFRALESLDLQVVINERPVELLTEAISLDEDYKHASYDREAAAKCWRNLASSAFVLEEFRAGFIGKCSPVHFFWGSFDLAASRFSGRLAPLPPNADSILREAYSHEVSSVGFWPGDIRYPHPAFYAYHVPKPDRYERAAVPDGAFWHEKLQEFLLPLEALRQSRDPHALLLEFCRKTYEAGAELAAWDRKALERQPTPPAPGADTGGPSGGEAPQLSP